MSCVLRPIQIGCQAFTCYIKSHAIVFPLKSICWHLLSKVMVLGSGAFGRCLGDEGGAIMNGISAFIKEISESSLAPSARWGHRENVGLSVNQIMDSHQIMNLWAPWSWTSHFPELGEINLLCIKPPSLRYSVVSAWTKRQHLPCNQRQQILKAVATRVLQTVTW